MNVLLLGASGQLGQAFVALSKTAAWPHGWKLISWDRVQNALADFSKPENLVTAIRSVHIDTPIHLIINAAAYTQVDQAEKERELAMKVNAESPKALADFCSSHGVILVHYSSDYVYSGTGNQAYEESELVAPQNHYGVSKAQGDHEIIGIGPQYLILRTSWVYSYTGKNFVLTMLKLGKEREQLKIVSDQVGAPSYAPDLARYSLQVIQKALLQKPFPSGVYHLCNSGTTSWHEFAQEIFKLARAKGMELKVSEVLPIPSSDYPTPAKRPLNSRLNLQKLEKAFHLQPRSWKAALAECLEMIGRNS